MEPAARPPRHIDRRVIRRRRIVVGTLAALVVALVVVAATAFFSLNNGIHRSALGSGGTGVAQNTGETNILVMGLDSRLDENGKPLPAAMYNALHAENQDVGGYNTNVLMLIHIPAGGGQAVGISIPRDDYVTLPGAPDGVAQAKIKEAYGLMMDQTLRHLVNTKHGESYADEYQQARAAGRREAVDTVSQFLGGVHIDHFIEVTMAAFYKLAVAVQPITVCLNEATSDTYSGADFRAGVQQLDAKQAVAFVRQRRDTSGHGPNLTDLDRERRQQAFIISLATKLKHENVFTNLPLMSSLVDTAKSEIALDNGFALLSFASVANRLAGGDLTFHTLPITGYGSIDGQDVNMVDLSAIRKQTAQLIAASNASARTGHTTSSSGGGQASGGTGHAATPTPRPTQTYSAPGSLDPAPITSGGIPCVN